LRFFAWISTRIRFDKSSNPVEIAKRHILASNKETQILNPCSRNLYCNDDLLIRSFLFYNAKFDALYGAQICCFAKTSKRKSGGSILISFLEIYQKEIAPKLKALDILLKSMDEPITAAQAAKALCVSEAEALSAMKSLGVKTVDRKALLDMMEVATSGICRLYQREKRIGSPFVYTREDVAYIYDLPMDAVNQACEELGIIKLTSYTMADMFSRLRLQEATL
jgi:hypothetical protein